MPLIYPIAKDPLYGIYLPIYMWLMLMENVGTVKFIYHTWMVWELRGVAHGKINGWNLRIQPKEKHLPDYNFKVLC